VEEQTLLLSYIELMRERKKKLWSKTVNTSAQLFMISYNQNFLSSNRHYYYEKLQLY